ncbi:MAG: tetratricopeptide repeat protein [Candidatus Aminicenantes bacterium]|nr:tetratricopeptide repeat protein [Candidatus Aminicenantes bacterium]
MDYEMGLRLANRALERNPELHDLRLRQAAVLWKLGRREVAWMALERVLKDEKAKPSDDFVWQASALAAIWRYQEGKSAEAEAFARTAEAAAAVKLRPDRGAKPLWAPAFAPGLREIAPQRESQARSLFPPNAGLPSYLLGLISEARSGWTRDTEAYYLRAMGLSYEARDCILRIAAGRMRSGNAAGAIEAALGACDAGGAYPDFYLLAAAAAESAGDRRAAEEYLGIAVELKPFIPSWLRAQAIVESGAGHKAAAAAILNRVLRLAPDDFRARELLEGVSRERYFPADELGRELSAAWAALQRGLEPRWRFEPRGKPADVAAFINNRFFGFLGEGLVDDAARYLEAYLEIDAGSPSLQYNLAQLHHTRDRLAPALPRAWASAALKPDYRDALDALASLYFDLGDFERSLTTYAEALAFSPEDPTAWFNSACARLASGDRVGAEAELLRAVELDRERPAAATERRTSDKAAGLAYEVDVQADSIGYRALVLLGSIRFDRGERERAAESLEEAVRRRPGSPDAYLELGKVRQAMGDDAAAKAAFDRFLALGGSASKVEAARKR